MKITTSDTPGEYECEIDLCMMPGERLILLVPEAL